MCRVHFAAMAATAEKPRRRYRMTDEERARRSKHIGKFSKLGGAASAKRPKTDIQRCAAAGGQARAKYYQLMKAAMSPESPEELRRQRLEVEAKRGQILEALTKAALGQQAPDADCAIISAALRELRAEADRLIDREARAKAEQAEQAAAGPARVALVPAILPALVAADPAPDSPGLTAD
jgi:hypothetical protein